MTDSLISRQAAIDMFNRLADDPWNANANTTWSKAYGYAAEMIEELPSAHERKTGKWIEIEKRYGWYCSNCKAENYYAYHWNESNQLTMQDRFCPNCGAEMKGEEE